MAQISSLGLRFCFFCLFHFHLYLCFPPFCVYGTLLVVFFGMCLVVRFGCAFFRYLMARGVNRTLDPVADVGLREWTFYTQGEFSMAGSDGLFFLRLEGGWGFTIVALRAELQAAGLLDDVMAPLDVWTGSFANGSYLLDSPFMDRPGFNSDLTRVLLHDRLAYVLALDTQGDDRGTQVSVAALHVIVVVVVVVVVFCRCCCCCRRWRRGGCRGCRICTSALCRVR